jgi:hypothetical protein
MNTLIFIPKTIKVGYQERSDTYTGQLAYVIYYDQKGKLRKETSWNGWRDNKIEPQEFSNEPTSGFVLNKKVGDYVSDWNHRQAYVRVYDPRNFEFEVTIENLLYILENASSIKGKGLEGDFVYGWDGKDLLLMPVDSPDYKEITKYSEMILRNSYVKAKDLKLGATYKTKTNEEWIYMGRFDYYKEEYESILTGEKDSWGYSKYKRVTKNVNKKKHHFFVRETISYNNQPYLSVLTIKSLGDRFVDIVSTDCVENYVELFDKLECKTEYSPYDESKDEYIQYSFDEFVKLVGELDLNDTWYSTLKIKSQKDFNQVIAEIRFDKESNLYYSRGEYIRKTNSYIHNNIGTLEDVFKKYNPIYKNEYLENGKLYRRLK